MSVRDAWACPEPCRGAELPQTIMDAGVTRCVSQRPRDRSIEGRSAICERTKEAEAEVQTWLVVLARCFELHDAVGVLELDRVLDASPDELDRHRLGLKSARRDRLDLISERTEHLLDRMNAAVGMANSRVLFNPKQSPAVVRSSNHVATEVHEFHNARDRFRSDLSDETIGRAAACAGSMHV